MAREERCVLTNMVMVCDGTRILVQDRLNPDWPGITFPGGHVEPCEAFADSAVREVKEETGLDIADVRLCGVQQWAREGEPRHVVFCYKTSTFSGELKSSEEGRVFWIEPCELKNLRLSTDFAEMYAVFADDGVSENCFLGPDDDRTVLTR